MKNSSTLLYWTSNVIKPEVSEIKTIIGHDFLMNLQREGVNSISEGPQNNLRGMLGLHKDSTTRSSWTMLLQFENQQHANLKLQDDVHKQ